MVWGGISAVGSTTAQRYRDEVLQPVALLYLRRNLGPNAVFQDDNARPHRARIINEYLRDEGIERMEWPASSPDLNPIEHLWDQLGRSVRQRVTDRTTLADLRLILVEEWNAIPQLLVTRLVNGMRRRCQAVVAGLGSS